MRAHLSCDRPSGKETGKTRVRLRPGLRCDIEDGPWKLTAGVSENSGGTSAGPDPGTFGRGALGSCLAMNYANWAAKLDVPIEAIEVEVEGDYDVRGFYGLAELPPGYSEVRYRVKIESDAPEEAIRKVWTAKVLARFKERVREMVRRLPTAPKSQTNRRAYCS
jgi:uncharacterized OsmC-like protein